MPVALGIDLGTTTITGLALSSDQGERLAMHSLANDARKTSSSDGVQGRSEWDAPRIGDLACQCLRAVVEDLGPRLSDVAAIGITGQQHGVVLLDDGMQPVSPLINWQDRRAEASYPGSVRSYVQEAVARAGPDAPQRTGCRLAAGFMGTTLFWMRENGVLPLAGTACLIADYLASRLTGQRPVTDPTGAASSGLLHLASRQWDDGLIEALGLARTLFPEVREAGQVLGKLSREAAAATGLAEGTPVSVALGDHQAAFVGSVADRGNSVLVNVGTGGQVAGFVDRCLFAPPLETRPFPGDGYLLVEAGLCGGRSYAILERFLCQVGEQLLGRLADGPLFERMNRLAADVPRGAGGLHCQPLFTGTRANPELRASWSGISPENFTPAKMTRALLEGMARTFREGYGRIEEAAGTLYNRLIGSGNALRENAVLASIVAEEFEMPLEFPCHREEAATGAALMAACAADLVADLADGGRLIQTNQAAS